MLARHYWLLLIPVFLTACQFHTKAPSAFVKTDVQHVNWTKAELQQDIAIRHLFRNSDSSIHIIRLAGNEFPHYHDKHDLTVHVLSGSSRLHFKNRSVDIEVGDVIFIPRGVYHWAENTGADVSLVLVQFSPAFDGKDRRRALD